MSQHLIGRYLNELSDLKQVSGAVRESVVSEAFKTLLKDWGRSKDLIFVPQYEIEAPTRERRYVDGALLHELRVPFGFWEAKDEEDDLDAEIQRKFRRGYPQDNIVFEDSEEAVLIHEHVKYSVKFSRAARRVAMKANIRVGKSRDALRRPDTFPA